MIIIIVISSLNLIVKSRYKMLSYAGYVDPESTLAIEVHHDGHLEDTERTFCSLYHTLMFPVHGFAVQTFLQFFLKKSRAEVLSANAATGVRREELSLRCPLQGE